MVDKINELEKKYDDILNDFLNAVSNEINIFEENKRIAVDNYACTLSKRIVKMMSENYNIKVEEKIISESVTNDLNKVIVNYNKKYEEQLFNYDIIEAILNDDIEQQQKGAKLNEYLKNIKTSYLTEPNFIKSLNETFTKRIFVRMVNDKLIVNKEDSNKIINNIYFNVKDETTNFTSDLNEKFVNTSIRVSSMGQKIIEAIAQLEMLIRYKKQDGEDELEYTSRISRLKNTYNDEEMGD